MPGDNLVPLRAQKTPVLAFESELGLGGSARFARKLPLPLIPGAGWFNNVARLG